MSIRYRPSGGVDTGNLGVMQHNGRPAGGGYAAILKADVTCVCDNHAGFGFYVHIAQKHVGHRGTGHSDDVSRYR